ncbi:hypothetical protein [Chitinophaga flava]|nr:hypothetical protein [Chitinophaga flava]
MSQKNILASFPCLLVIHLSLGFDLSHPLFTAIITTYSTNKGASMELFSFFRGYGLGSLVLSLIFNIVLERAFQLYCMHALIAGTAAMFVFRKER